MLILLQLLCIYFDTMVPGRNVNGCVIELIYIPYAREALLRLGGPWSLRFTKTIVAFSYGFHLPSTIPQTNTYREHPNRSDIPIDDLSHPSHAIGAYLRRFLLAMVVWVVTLTIPALSSTKPSGIHQITKICSSPVKFLVVASSHIICQRRSWEASVIGRQLSQSTLMQVNFSSQTDKKSPSKWRTGRSFAPAIKQAAQRTYQSSTRVEIARFGAFRPTICCIWMFISRNMVPRWTANNNSERWKFFDVCQNEPLTAFETVAKVYKYLSLGHRKKISTVVENSTGLVFISTDVDAAGDSRANFFARFSGQYLDVAKNSPPNTVNQPCGWSIQPQYQAFTPFIVGDLPHCRHHRLFSFKSRPVENGWRLGGCHRIFTNFCRRSDRDAKSYASTAKLLAQRTRSEAEVTIEGHLGGHLGAGSSRDGWIWDWLTDDDVVDANLSFRHQ